MNTQNLFTITCIIALLGTYYYSEFYLDDEVELLKVDVYESSSTTLSSDRQYIQWDVSSISDTMYYTNSTTTYRIEAEK